MCDCHSGVHFVGLKLRQQSQTYRSCRPFSAAQGGSLGYSSVKYRCEACAIQLEGGWDRKYLVNNSRQNIQNKNASLDHEACKGVFLSLTRLCFCEGNRKDSGHWQQREKTHYQWRVGCFVSNERKVLEANRKIHSDLVGRNGLTNAGGPSYTDQVQVPSISTDSL